MPTTHSPLRYPGGKTQLFPLLRAITIANNLRKGVYAEPFVGGAGLGLEMLLSGWMAELWINDLDPAIHAFWHAVLHQPDELCRRIEITAITIDEWHQQREVLARQNELELIDLAFATLFLNRTNRSGIIKGGVIGGRAQEGKYKLDCRFNKADLCRKIKRISLYKPVIKLTNLDAEECLQIWNDSLPRHALINIDPPYYRQGQALYMNHYQPADHASLANIIRQLKPRWMLTYDNVEEIASLYKGFPMYHNALWYTAQVKRKTNELVVLSPKLLIPSKDHTKTSLKPVAESA